MKKLALPILMTIALVFTGAVIFTSCTKEGPQGPAGADGKNGTNGNANCGQCHDLSSKMVAIIGQYDNSIHGTGMDHERNTTDCAPCHTSQGFIEVIGTGADATAEDIENPARINCRTCHKIHTTYTAADYAFRVTTPRTLRIHGDVIDIGIGNLCAQCHQGRAFDAGQEPDPNNLNDSITIASSRYGVHHGPQANIFSGHGGFEIAGSMSYTVGPLAHINQIPDACPVCHMATAFGYQAGGHTWNMTYTSHGAVDDNVAGCLDCHPGAADFDINGFQTEIQELEDSLGNWLIANDYMTASFSVKTKTVSALVAGALWNHQIVREDRSLGAHNPAYVKALLVNTLENLP